MAEVRDSEMDTGESYGQMVKLKTSFTQKYTNNNRGSIKRRHVATSMYFFHSYLGGII